MNTEELASVFHLPAVSVETPNIAWAGSKKGEPPSNLPLEGSVDASELTILGETDFRTFRHKFGMKQRDRRLHMYSIGKTGTGKSTLLLNMIVDDIEKGRGVAVVDPHGQLVHDVLQRIPNYRVNDIVYFNPADRDFPIGFNLFENVDPDLRNVVASGIVGVFKKIFGESWGPRLEYILRNAVLALLYYPDTTLLGVNRMLTDPAYEHRILRKVTDPVIRDFFENEYDKYDPKFRREAIASIQNKIGQFLSSATIRNIVGQPRSSINIRDIMDSGKILLLDLSIGKIGEDNAQLLGSMLITKIQLAAMSRADVAEADRRDFYLYVDEFQNFATESFAVILSEARKYHLNLMLTNQYIAQMPEEVAKAVFGNVGTVVSFRVGSSDAAGLAKEFEPVFESHDLVNLDNYHIYAKMAIDGVTRPAFSAKTLVPPPIVEEGANVEKVIRVSRERYAKPRDFVEQKIQDWADDVQVRQAQEWRKSVQEREAQVTGQSAGTGPAPSTSQPAFQDSRVQAQVPEPDVGQGSAPAPRPQQMQQGTGQPRRPAGSRLRSQASEARGSQARPNPPQHRQSPSRTQPSRGRGPVSPSAPSRGGERRSPRPPSQPPAAQPPRRPEQGSGVVLPPRPQPTQLVSEDDIASLRAGEEQRGGEVRDHSNDTEPLTPLDETT
ncbi:type IV secretion system DNA-binding domain-containing protein [Candidatus Berkelbacteria bacterium]|nr:type IV secretion system DNA-binding domain-containing protein [Candidatus Berkelbacteria bacterium]